MLNIYKAEIKEKMNESILKPSLYTEEFKTRKSLIDMWGLNEKDIEWFKLYRVIDGREIEL